VVEDVEGLAAQLQVEAAEVGVLDERHVDVELLGLAQRVAADVAVGGRRLGRRTVGRRLEPLVDVRVGDVGIFDDVRPGFVVFDRGGEDVLGLGDVEG
jgi:hypothetical protein